MSGKRVFFHKIQSHCAAAFLARDSQNWSTRQTPTAAIGYAAKGTPASLRLLRARSRSLSNTRCGNSLPVRVPRCPPVLVASDVRHQSGGRLTPRAWFPARRVHTRYPSEPRTLLAALSAVSGYKKKNPRLTQSGLAISTSATRCLTPTCRVTRRPAPRTSRNSL